MMTTIPRFLFPIPKILSPHFQATTSKAIAIAASFFTFTPRTPAPILKTADC